MPPLISRCRLAHRCSLALALLFAAHCAFAADQIWSATPTDGNWIPSVSGVNWGSAGVFPGALNTTTNADTGSFNASSSSRTDIAINTNVGDTLNIKGINFSGSTVAAYTIGSTSGNSLVLSSGGSISIASGTGGSNLETVNAPLILASNAAGTTGSYTFSSASSTNAHQLVIGGAISGGAATGAITLSLVGGLGGTISGRISDGSAVGHVALSKSAAGTWVLSAANTYSGGTTVTAGALGVSNVINGNDSATGSGPVSVSGTGVIQGTGNLAGVTTVGVGGALSPGATGTGGVTAGSIGTLKTGDEVLISGGAWQEEVLSSSLHTVASADEIVMGALDTSQLSNTSKFTINLIRVGSATNRASSLNYGTTILLAHTSSAISTAALNSLFNLNVFVAQTAGNQADTSTTYDLIAVAAAGGGTDIEATATPELGTSTLFGTAVALSLLVRRRLPLITSN